MRLAWLALLCACGRVDFDPLASAWPGWPYRVPVVIDHTKVAGDLADFPVLIAIRDPALVAHAAGHVAFTDAAGAPLAFELEHDAADPASTIAWVKVPVVSATADTTLYLYYGNATAPDQAQPREVWTNGFAGVYHFGDGTALDVHDATAMNDATNSGATPIAGMIAGAADLDGMSNVTTPTAGLDTMPGAVNTVTYWLYFLPPFGRGTVSFYTGTTVYDVWFVADGCEGFNTGQGEVLGTTATGLAGRWVYVAAVFYNGVPVYDPAQPAHSNALYLDGVAQPLSFSCSPGTPVAGGVLAQLHWGSNLQGATNYRMAGHLDEGRFAVGTRSAAWIQTEFANQGDPAGFVTVGPEQAF